MRSNLRIRNVWVIPCCFLKEESTYHSQYILLKTKLAPVRMKMGQLLRTKPNKELVKLLLVIRFPKLTDQNVKK
jgi:hypothetical protein